MSESRKGCKLSESQKKKISGSLKGRKSPPFSEEWKKNIGMCRIGRPLSKDHKKKISITAKQHGVGRWMKGRIEGNFWKGENATYRAKHSLIERRLGKPTKCENCGRDGLTGRKIHWANKSRTYKITLNDWIRLCAKCHMAYDRNQIVPTLK